MRVTIVSHDVGPVSGMERQLIALIEGLVARDVQVRVVSRTCELPSAGAVEHVRIGPPNRPFTVAFPWFALQAARAVGRHRDGLVQVTNCLAPIRADVVAIHFLHAGAELAGAAPSLPSASLPYRLNQALARREFRSAERWQLEPGHHRAVVAVSGGLADELRTHYPEAAAPQVIPNGLDTDAFSPGPADTTVRAALSVPRGSRIAAFVGGGWKGKGLAAAIAALPHAPDWSIAVVGEGDERPFLAQAREQGVADRLRFAGKREDLPAVFRSVDALVLPSAYETFSLVAHEAAACGCPVVATRVSGISDFLRDGVTGFYVERDGRSIAAALARVAALDDGSLGALRAASRAAVIDRTTAAMVDRYVELYGRLGAR